MSTEKVKKAIMTINQHPELADFDGQKDGSLIAQAEGTLGVRFPDSYRFFVENLGCGDIGGREFYGLIGADFFNSGIPDAVWITLKERKEASLSEKHVIVMASGEGRYYVINCHDTTSGYNPVQLWCPGTDTYEYISDDFGDFLFSQVSEALL